jgi:hypothetical protein
VKPLVSTRGVPPDRVLIGCLELLGKAVSRLSAPEVLTLVPAIIPGDLNTFKILSWINVLRSNWLL